MNLYDFLYIDKKMEEKPHILCILTESLQHKSVYKMKAAVYNMNRKSTFKAVPVSSARRSDRVITGVCRSRLPLWIYGFPSDGAGRPFFIVGQKEGLWMEQVKKAEIMDEGAMRRAVNRISYEIIEHNHGAANLVLAGVRTRGVFLAERMADKIAEVEGTCPQVISLDITGFRDDKPEEQSKIPLPVIEAISRKTVIIVDDVLYTGRTVRAAMEVVLHMGRAQRIQLAALIDRGHRELPIRPDYVGKNLPTSRAETVRVNMKEFDGKDSVVILTGAEN